MGIELVTADGKNPKINITQYRLTMPETARKAVNASAKAVERVVLAGSPARLRGVGTSGAPLSVRIYQAGSAAQPQAVVKAVGPWQFIENDTKAHLIVSKKLGGGRRRRTGLASGLFVRAAGRRITTTRRGERGAIRTPQGIRAYAQHPGTKGKHPWAKGVERATPAATLAFVKTVEADLRKQFG